MEKIFLRILRAKFSTELTHSAAHARPKLGSKARKRRSGSTLSKPRPSGRGVEGLTVDRFLIKYIVVRTEGIPERGHTWKTKF